MVKTWHTTPKDLLWTLNCIYTGNPWAVPSGGSVFIFKHETFEFKTFTLAEKNDAVEFLQTDYHQSSLFGLHRNKQNTPGVQSTAELLEKFFNFSTDEIDRSLIEGLRKRPHDERFEQR